MGLHHPNHRLGHPAQRTIWDDLLARGYTVSWEESPRRPRFRRREQDRDRGAVSLPVVLCVAGVFLFALAVASGGRSGS